MTDPERIEFLQGQVQCLLALSFALIETHQDKALLKAHLDANLEAVLAKLFPSPVEEALLSGVEDMKKKILQYATSSAARQSGA